MPIDKADDFIDGNESSQSEVGKYLLIDVPDYNHGTGPADLDGNGIPNPKNQMRSFLRMGASPADWAQDPGLDLVKLAYQVGPAGKEPLDPAPATGFLSTVGTEKFPDVFPLFIDDQRERGVGNVTPPGANGHGLPMEDRVKESENFLTRGGWRDHTEGNRITTTRGDKIEVVHGNYKLIVMGRQPDPGQGSGWEATGNHIQDFASGTMPGASVTLTWIPEAYEVGAWLLQNSTEKVYQYSRNAGNFKTENWGDLLETYTGSENPVRMGVNDDDGTQGHPKTHTIPPSRMPVTAMPSAPSKDLPRGNPRIIDRVWAESIEANKGSAAWRIPQIDEETWAEKMSASVNADTITSTTKANKIVATTTTDSIVTTTYAGAVIETTIAGMVVETIVAPMIETFVGLKLSIDLSAAIEITTGYKLELNLNHKSFFSPVEDEITPLKTSIHALQNNLGVILNEVTNTKSTVATTCSELAVTRNELDTVKNTLATRQAQINVTYNLLAVAVFL